MIIVDANILLYAYYPRSAQHKPAKLWVEEAFAGLEPIRLPWNTILAFLRISTNPRVYEQPLAIDEAERIVSSWLDLPQVGTIDPGERYWEILRTLVVVAQVTGPLVTDAALAALALEHGATLCTSDRDFARFPKLKLINPVAG